MDFEMPLVAPEGYSYEYTKHNAHLIAIWLRHHKVYDYNLGDSVKSIWGFYSQKKKEYYSPISASKCGDKVDIIKTTPYTAMQIRQTILEKCFI